MKKHLLGRFESESGTEPPTKKLKSPPSPPSQSLPKSPNSIPDQGPMNKPNNIPSLSPSLDDWCEEEIRDDDDGDDDSEIESDFDSSSTTDSMEEKVHLPNEDEMEPDDDDNTSFAEQFLMDERGWESKYNQLKEFKKKYSHCNVSRQDTEWKALTWWVPNQRTARRKGLLSKERIKKLDSIDFEWDRSGKGCENAWNLYWNKQYEQLKLFQKKYGHLDVPRREERYKSLGWWVYNMRQMKKKGKMSEDRVKKLEYIGFEWDRVAKRGRKPKKDQLSKANLQNSPKRNVAEALAALCSEEFEYDQNTIRAFPTASYA